MYVRNNAHIYVRSNITEHIQHTHTQAYARTHAHTHAHRHTHARTHTHTQTHGRTHRWNVTGNKRRDGKRKKTQSKITSYDIVSRGVFLRSSEEMEED